MLKQARTAATIVLSTVGVLLTGCADSSIRSDQPLTLTTPYEAPTAVVWAVVPVANESGTSAADELAITDKLVQSIREVNGITSLSTNRVITGLDALGLDTVRTPGEALTLAELLGADAIVVPVLTSWDPYDPPRVGIDADVYARSGVMGVPDDPMTPFDLARAVNDRPGDSWDPARPVAVVSLELDGSNGAVRSDVRAFAEGRADPQSATGWRGYIRSMQRFETYAAFATVRAIMQSEAARSGKPLESVFVARKKRGLW